ncbi:MAG: pentapeptide repeat-containing protein [bacterium]|nr:pentapeptide repeat-containing protein [bacterium]
MSYRFRAWSAKLLQRSLDRRRWPRALWHPVYTVPATPDEKTRALLKHVSGTIQKLIFAILGACVFCVMTLGKSDIELLTNEAEIAVPFTGVKIDYAGFILFAPVALIVLNAYLQLFIERWFRARLVLREDSAAHFFNMRTPAAILLTHFLFYWIVPIALLAFMIKALPHPRSAVVIWIGSSGILMNLCLLIRRTLGRRRGALNLPGWSAALFFLYVSGAVAVGSAPWPMSRVIQLYRADLAGREINGFHLERADMRSVDLSGADLRCSRLGRANLVRGDLRAASLYRADFSGAILLSADLRKTRLLKANFFRANLGSADLREARVSDPLPESDRNLAHLTNWLDDTLTLIDEPRPVLDSTACDIAWDRLASVDEIAARSPIVLEHPGLLEREDIVQFIFAPDRFLYGFFVEANLRGADLSDGGFPFSDFARADLSAAQMTRSDLRHSLFREALLRDSDLRDANLRGAVFQGADLSGADLRGADVTDAFFGGADLSGADLRGVAGLTAKQLARAENLSEARLAPGFARSVVGR